MGRNLRNRSKILRKQLFAVHRLRLDMKFNPTSKKVGHSWFDGKKRDEILGKIKQVPLSDSTAMRRIELLAEDLVLQLNERLKSTNCISLAIDESTEMTDNSRLIVFVRYYDESKKEFIEDLFGVTALKERTQEEDIYKALKSIVHCRIE